MNLPPDYFHGICYELCMSYTSHETLQRASEYLWACPVLKGPIERRFGYLSLADGQVVLCYTDVVCEGETESLGLYMPDRDADGREKLIDAAFIQLARFVFAREPFVWARWGQLAGATKFLGDKHGCLLVENGILALYP